MINLTTKAAIVNQLLSKWSYYKSKDVEDLFGVERTVSLNSHENDISVMDENISGHISCSYNSLPEMAEICRHISGPAAKRTALGRNNNSTGVRRGYMCTTGTEETWEHPDMSVCVLSSLSLSLKSFHLWNETFVMVFLVLTAGGISFLPAQWSRWSTALWVLAKGLNDVDYTFPLAFVFLHL